MNITGGYHYHTIRADSEEILDNIEKQLNFKGYIAPGE
ncbi:MAG: 3H domain-containing protein [Ruminococcus sp.]|nr:3H domain-containing protein [Ruminococcus sp.]